MPCSPGGDDGGSDTAAVTINTFTFDPDPITVVAGTSITFTNEDGTVHTVTSGTRDDTDGRFDHPLSRDESVTVTFDEPGVYDYFCSIHAGPGMEGGVIVE